MAANVKETFVEALKAGASGAASYLLPPILAPKESTAAAAIPQTPGMLDGLPSWVLPAAGAAVVALVLLRK